KGIARAGEPHAAVRGEEGEFRQRLHAEVDAGVLDVLPAIKVHDAGKNMVAGVKRVESAVAIGAAGAGGVIPFEVNAGSSVKIGAGIAGVRVGGPGAVVEAGADDRIRSGAGHAGLTAELIRGFNGVIEAIQFAGKRFEAGADGVNIARRGQG